MHVQHYGTDGFGHQLDARICFMALEFMEPTKIVYYNRPVYALDHISGGQREIDFINDAFRIPSDEPQAPGFKRVPTYYMFKFEDRRDLVYEYDNPWHLVYSPDYVGRMDQAILESPRIQEMRDKVHNDPVFDPNHDPKYFNVAVHIRRTDSGYQSNVGYFLRCVDYAKEQNTTGKPIKFHVDTDDWNWPGLVDLERAMNQQIRPQPRTIPMIIGSFARSDFFIGSNSSLSWAGIFLRNPGAIAAAVPFSDRLELRKPWVAKSVMTHGIQE